MEYAAAALVVIAALIPIVGPVLRPPLIRLREAAGPAADLARLEERKAAVYGAIREVGFDLRTDKMSEEDYEHEVAALKREAVEIVSEIATLQKNPPRGPETVEAEVAAARARTDSAPGSGTSFCTQCGSKLGDEDRFCGQCGTSVSGVTS